MKAAVGLLLVKLEAALMNFGGKLNQLTPCRKTGSHLHIHQPTLRCTREARLLMDIPYHISLAGAAPRAVTPSRGRSPRTSCSAAREGSQPANTAPLPHGSAPSAAPRSPSEEQIHTCNQSTRRYEKKALLRSTSQTLGTPL